MIISITLEELFSMAADYAQIGYMEAVKAYEPAQDRIRLTEVKRWLKMMRIDMKTFKFLVEKGYIKSSRIGKAKNSPIYYSKQEIKFAMSTVKIDNTIIRNIMNKC